MSTADTTAGAGAAGAAAENGHITGFATKGYRSYVLTSLLVIYILNFVDRALLGVVGPALLAELRIDDFVFGLLTGPAFAILYTFIGLPLARVAETRNRVWIIAICLALWSLMTALCGLANPVTIGGFTIGAIWVLAACRVGVGIGEAGCTPPANSLIADYYPPSRRSTALGYYAMGVTIGTGLSYLIGGTIVDLLSWRAAFILLGLPGIAVAVLFKLTVKEPPRGYSDPPNVVKQERAELSVAVRELLSKPSYWVMTVGATLAAFCGYAIAVFQSLYIQRTFGLTAGEAAVWLVFPSYLASAVGTFFVGWLAERMMRRSQSAIAWMPGLGLIICVPFYFLAFTTPVLLVAFIGLCLGGFIKYGYLAAQYTIGQGVVSMRVRATSIAVLLFVVNLFGYGLGPTFAGIVSEQFFARQVAGSEYAAAVTRVQCNSAQYQVILEERRLRAEAPESVSVPAVLFGGQQRTERVVGAERATFLATLEEPISVEQYEFCVEANASSTRTSMLAISLIYALAGLMFLLCALRLNRDMIAK